MANSRIATMKTRTMKLTMDSMAPVLSLLSLVDCFIPTLGLPYQCALVFCLISFSSAFKSIISNVTKTPREILKYVLGEATFLVVAGGLARVWRTLVEGYLPPTQQRHDRADTNILNTALKLWRTIITILWFPVYLGSSVAVVVQGAIVQSAVLALDEWDSFSIFADRKPDVKKTWNAHILQRVKDVWNWLAKDERVVRLVLILFCRLVLGGPPWLYAVAFRLFCLTVMVCRPSLFSAGAWLMCELVHDTVGWGLLGLVHLDRLIVFILPFGPNTVPLDGELTLVGQAYYLLLPSRVLLGALTVASRQASLRQMWASMKFRDMEQQIRSENDPRDPSELLCDEEFMSYCGMYLTFRTSWHVMALLYSWECGPGLGASWWTLPLKVVFGVSIRLIILNCHLSFGGWRT